MTTILKLSEILPKHHYLIYTLTPPRLVSTEFSIISERIFRWKLEDCNLELKMERLADLLKALKKKIFFKHRISVVVIWEKRKHQDWSSSLVNSQERNFTKNIK